MLIKLLLFIVVVCVALFLSFLLVNTKRRNKMLGEWAECLFNRLSLNEKEAIVKLFGFYRRKEVLLNDSDFLKNLNPLELSHLKKISEPFYRPSIFSGGRLSDLSVWGSMFLANKKRGYTDDQATIITGIIFNRLYIPIEKYEKGINNEPTL